MARQLFGREPASVRGDRRAGGVGLGFGVWGLGFGVAVISILLNEVIP